MLFSDTLFFLFFTGMVLLVFTFFGMSNNWSKRTLLAAVTAWALCLISMVLFDYGMEYTGSKKATVVRFDSSGLVEAKSNDALFCPPLFINCVKIPRSSTVSASVHPITDNPKVRGLKYAIEVEVLDTRTFFGLGYGDKDGDWEANNRRISELVEYWLYEFNNAHSRDLAVFYNPFDVRQQQALETLLGEYLKNKSNLSSKGIRFVRLESFSVD